MTTYRELLARRNEFAIYSPEWKEIGDLIDAYVRAQILAGHMEFANMIVGDLGDIAECGRYAHFLVKKIRQIVDFRLSNE